MGFDSVRIPFFYGRHGALSPLRDITDYTQSMVIGFHHEQKNEYLLLADSIGMLFRP